MKASTRRLIVSCEHGGNKVPPPYRHLFKGKQRVLDSHRGLDIGALAIARAVSRRLEAPLVYSDTSRLLVDLNRSFTHRAVFSEFTRPCSDETRAAILREYYRPYREKVQNLIASSLAGGQPVLHLSIHSFTPRLGNRDRNTEIGLLYDPARRHEKDFCKSLQEELIRRRPDIKVRLNYPYRGNADGLTTSLRKEYGENEYLGIEIEINQKIAVGKSRQIGQLLTDAIHTLM